jgi:hypothetical protein
VTTEIRRLIPRVIFNLIFGTPNQTDEAIFDFVFPNQCDFSVTCRFKDAIQVNSPLENRGRAGEKARETPPSLFTTDAIQLKSVL